MWTLQKIIWSGKNISYKQIFSLEKISTNWAKFRIKGTDTACQDLANVLKIFGLENQKKMQPDYWRRRHMRTFLHLFILGSQVTVVDCFGIAVITENITISDPLLRQIFIAGSKESKDWRMKMFFHCKKVNGFPVPSRDFTNQSLPGRE